MRRPVTGEKRREARRVAPGSADDRTRRPLPGPGDGQCNMPEPLRMLRELRETRKGAADLRVAHGLERIGRQAGRDGVASRTISERAGFSSPSRRPPSASGRACELEAEKAFAEKPVEASREGLPTLGRDLRAGSANRTPYGMFQAGPAETPRLPARRRHDVTDRNIAEGERALLARERSPWLRTVGRGPGEAGSRLDGGVRVPSAFPAFAVSEW